MINDSAHSGLRSVIIQCPSSKIADMMAAMIASNSENSRCGKHRNNARSDRNDIFKKARELSRRKNERETKEAELIPGHGYYMPAP